jgi:inorganic phosphate transporter, PiT family
MRSRREGADCACVAELKMAAPAAMPGGQAPSAAVRLPRLILAPETDCDRLPVSNFRLSVPSMVEHVHIVSATSICFARGVNDTPKLAALLVAARIAGLQVSAGLVALMIAIGGLLLARRVAETMSLRINHMDAAQGVSANIITALLVLFASKFGLPVSTTHVSVGSIAGVGAGAGTLDWATLRSVLLSWVVTLPCAAAVAWAVAAIVQA